MLLAYGCLLYKIGNKNKHTVVCYFMQISKLNWNPALTFFNDSILFKATKKCRSWFENQNKKIKKYGNKCGLKKCVTKIVQIIIKIFRKSKWRKTKLRSLLLNSLQNLERDEEKNKKKI